MCNQLTAAKHGAGCGQSSCPRHRGTALRARPWPGGAASSASPPANMQSSLQLLHTYPCSQQCTAPSPQQGRISPAAHALTQKVPAATGSHSQLFSQHKWKRAKMKGLRVHKAGGTCCTKRCPLLCGQRIAALQEGFSIHGSKGWSRMELQPSTRGSHSRGCSCGPHQQQHACPELASHPIPHSFLVKRPGSTRPLQALLLQPGTHVPHAHVAAASCSRRTGSCPGQVGRPQG